MLMKLLMVIFSVSFWVIMYGGIGYLVYDAFTYPDQFFYMKLGVVFFMLLLTLFCHADHIQQCRKCDKEE